MGFGQFITGFGRAVQDDIRKEISQKEAGNG